METMRLRIPQEATPSSMAHVFESQNGFGHDLGQTSASSESAPDIDIHNGGRPMSSDTAELTHYLKMFFHTWHCVNHYGMGNLSPGGSGM
jgi:hypothetical protein